MMKATPAMDAHRTKSFSRPSSILISDGDFAAGVFGSAAGELTVELPSFCVGVAGAADARSIVAGSEGSTRDCSDSSAKQTSAKGRKTRLTSAIDSIYHTASEALNLF